MQRYAIVFLCAIIVCCLAGCGSVPPPGGGDDGGGNGGSGGGNGGGGLEPTDGFTISGRVTEGGVGLAEVLVSVQGGSSVSTDSQGNYAIEGLASGNYTITPTLSGYVFEPAMRLVSVGPDAEGINFAATALGLPQLSDASASVEQIGDAFTIGARVTATHSGPGALEVFFLVATPDGTTETIVATRSGSVYSASYTVEAAQSGAYEVTVVGRDSVYPANETRLELGVVLLVPPGPPD